MVRGELTQGCVLHPELGGPMHFHLKVEFTLLFLFPLGFIRFGDHCSFLQTLRNFSVSNFL
jgi:hypothetical protein